MALPAEFVARLEALVPPERLAGCLASFGRPKRVAFRVNRLKVGVEEARDEAQALIGPVEALPWLAEGFVAPAAAREALTRSAAFGAGRIYLQNPSSLLAAVALGAVGGEEVLDLAAAPGGKTLHIAAMMGGVGGLAAVEPVRERFFRMKGNLERGGASWVRTYLKDGIGVGRACPARFDRVLLDAPCSSEARMEAHDPASFEHWSLRKIKECTRKQSKLLRSALDALKPGGVLVYCTCAFAPEENEAQVDALLRAGLVEPDPFEAPPGVPCTPGLEGWGGAPFTPAAREALRVLPDDLYDGFFLCRLRKR